MSWRVMIRSGDGAEWSVTKALYDENQARNLFFALRDTNAFIDVMLVRELRFSSRVETMTIEGSEKVDLNELLRRMKD